MGLRRACVIQVKPLHARVGPKLKPVADYFAVTDFGISRGAILNLISGLSRVRLAWSYASRSAANRRSKFPRASCADVTAELPSVMPEVYPQMAVIRFA